MDQVAVHLLDQPVDRVEALLAAHPLEERDPQLLPVEVPVEADQVRLDQQPAAGLERRSPLAQAA